PRLSLRRGQARLAEPRVLARDHRVGRLLAKTARRARRLARDVGADRAHRDPSRLPLEPVSFVGPRHARALVAAGGGARSGAVKRALKKYWRWGALVIGIAMLGWLIRDAGAAEVIAVIGAAGAAMPLIIACDVGYY